VISRFVGALLLGCALLLGAVLLGAVPASAAPTPTPPAPAECLAPNMVCVYESGTWVVDFRPRPPFDHGVAPGDPWPILFAVFAAFALFLGAVNLAGRIRRTARARTARPG
jgi:hypothetical protein